MPPTLLITAYLAIVAAILGLVVGSFVNCWAWRYVNGESIVRGRSHCTACGHDLAPRDLVPVFSWLAMRGRCRYCGEKVSARYPVTELVCAVAFAGIAVAYGPALETVELLAFAAILLFLSLTDLDEQIVPNGCIIAAAAVRACYLAVSFALGTATLSGIGYYVASGMGLGAALVVIVLVADRAFGRESMGGGDLKLYAVAGFYFGWQQGVFLVILSCIIGIVVGIASAGRASSGDSGTGPAGVLGHPFPFGPSIAVACIITMFAGGPFVSWYVGFLV